MNKNDFEITKMFVQCYLWLTVKMKMKMKKEITNLYFDFNIISI